MLSFFKRKVKDQSKTEQMAEIHPLFFEAFQLDVDCDMLPNARGEFGLAESNPVPVNHVAGSIKYLARLRCACGTGLMFHRLGSIKVQGIKGNVDAYETVCTEAQHWDILYLHFYHPRRSTVCPPGYTLAEFHPLFSKIAFGYGSNSRCHDFPLGIPDLMLAMYPPELSKTLARKLSQDLSNRAKYQQPESHRIRVERVLQDLATCTLSSG